jgi:hypothetical protein
VRIDAGSTGGGQVSSSNDKVLSIVFHARSSNGGSVYVGGDDVGPGNGYELTPDATVAPDFTLAGGDPNAGHVLFSSFYASVPGAGDRVDWFAILR